MAKINCPQCDKQFKKNGSGLQWHLAHIHGQIQEVPRSTPQVTGAQTSSEEQGELDTPADEDGNGELQVSETHEALDDGRDRVGDFDRQLTELEEKFDRRICDLEEESNRRFTDLETVVKSLSEGQEQIKGDMAVIGPLRHDVADVETRTLALSRVVLDLQRSQGLYLGTSTKRRRMSLLEAQKLHRGRELIRKLVKAADEARERENGRLNAAG